MAATVLCINAGSSSVKFKLYETGDGAEFSARIAGQLDGIGVRPHLLARDAGGASLRDERLDVDAAPTTAAAIDPLLEWLAGVPDALPPAVVGHRVVTGGTRFTAPTVLTGEALDELRRLSHLAPLHLPSELAAIDAIAARFPDVPQAAVFDTGFHRGRGALSRRLPIPASLHDEGLQRYGFHGSSYEFVAERLRRLAPELAAGRVVVAHLGSGCSLCALVAGRSVETTMSFTALDGVPMGTRPGRLDPGVVLYLMQRKHMSADDIEAFLYRECGLKGLSGISGDVRDLEASDAPAARLALDYFAEHCARAVAELGTAMGGLDGLVFTAGIGENAASVRAAIVRRLAWLGATIDDAANAAHGPRISRRDSALDCYVVPTDEELMIARHAWSVAAGETATQ